MKNLGILSLVLIFLSQWLLAPVIACPIPTHHDRPFTFYIESPSEHDSVHDLHSNYFSDDGTSLHGDEEGDCYESCSVAMSLVMAPLSSTYSDLPISPTSQAFTYLSKYYQQPTSSLYRPPIL